MIPRTTRICLGIASAWAALGLALTLCIATGRDFTAVMDFPFDWSVVVLAVGTGAIGGLLYDRSA
jgi:hypothetical protein